MLVVVNLVCRDLQGPALDEATWRACYAFNFVGDTAGAGIVRTCLFSAARGGGKGWKREAIAREKYL
jgi:hypothetical protein